ncbi:unnamed protein product, partial [Toxocara canis]|uniref:Sulfate_transp domain-containing protein n=1 Tax=Toxocara canis TaxID=6265 RepID=A0A183TWY6_TOXCA
KCERICSGFLGCRKECVKSDSNVQVKEEFDTRYHYISAEKRHCRLISRSRPTSHDRRQRLNALVVVLRENGFSGVLYDKVRQTLPITDYLSRYDWRKNVCGDLKEGLIEGMSHFPRALAFAQLAGINPFRGLFTAVFMPLLYVLFEYDIHLSMGE